MSNDDDKYMSNDDVKVTGDSLYFHKYKTVYISTKEVVMKLKQKPKCS